MENLNISSFISFHKTHSGKSDLYGLNFDVDSLILELADKWIFDSGASSHMPIRIEWFDHSSLCKLVMVNDLR